METETTTARCPRCGSPLLHNEGKYWCSFVGGDHEKACAFGIDKPVTARDLADEDARLFGMGYTRKYRDGRIEYIPPHEIFIHGNTIHVRPGALTVKPSAPDAAK